MSEPSPIPSERPALIVLDAPERGRYEGRLGEDGELAAILDYSLSELWIALVRTEVLEGYEGQGIGSQMVHGVIEDVRARGLKIIAKCPFVVRWLERHPDQQDILSRPLHPGTPPSPVDPREPA